MRRLLILALLLPIFFSIQDARARGAAGDVPGDPCDQKEIGTTKITREKKDIIACLVDKDDGKTYWTSTSGGTLPCQKLMDDCTRALSSRGMTVPVFRNANKFGSGAGPKLTVFPKECMTNRNTGNVFYDYATDYLQMSMFDPATGTCQGYYTTTAREVWNFLGPFPGNASCDLTGKVISCGLILPPPGEDSGGSGEGGNSG